MVTEVSDLRRRRLLLSCTAIAEAVAAAAAAVPFVQYLAPSARARAAAAPTRGALGKVEPGQQLTVEWRRKPVWVLHRSQSMLDHLRRRELRARLADAESSVVQQPDYARNPYRSIRPEYGVYIGICTHLGCIPTFRPEVAPADLGADWLGGYFCPCHGSRFDLAGRVFKDVPAPTNLVVPPYRFLSDTTIEVGVGPEDASKHP
jgi:ubiquinol-cytochrome c reductase iron-sulfur subunit